MTYAEAVLIREAGLNGRPVDPSKVACAIEVIASRRKPAAPKPVKNFGLTTLQSRRIDQAQVRMLEDVLRVRS